MRPEDEASAMSEVFCHKTAPVVCCIEPVGRWFEALLRRRSHSTSSLVYEPESGSDSEDEAGDEVVQLEDFPLLKTLDPKDWKNQDHYAVLGLASIRHGATQRQIKAAHKAMVLRHHPDKRKAAGQPTGAGEDDYFSCITKAIEILGDPAKRRAFDSVDPMFDNSIPSKAEGREEFFNTFSECFDRNARWSLKQHVPGLGGASASFEEVDMFYSFWYKFESWREFSYLDEEEKEKAECRDERRWIEKQNRAARAQRKKEEMLRVRSLVDTAYACDPRIRRFKEEEKARKESEKQARLAAKRQKIEEEERRRQEQVEAERLARESAGAAAKEQNQAARREREQQRKALKKERQRLRTACKNWGYFCSDGAENVHMMEEVEKLCNHLHLASLQGLNEMLEQATEGEAKVEINRKLYEVNEVLDQEKAQAQLQGGRSTGVDGVAQPAGGATVTNAWWSEEDVQLLIKSVNLFPAGTAARWEVIANFMNSHSNSGVKRMAKDVIAKTKTLQKLDPVQKDELNRRAYELYHRDHISSKAANVAEPSQRLDGQEAAKGEAMAPWTAAEQKLLEQALKTFGAGTAERWDRIADAVPGRSKKECVRRYKVPSSFTRFSQIVVARDIS
uniref:DnaJ (Hsp40) homolog, subfamily C, member 2 n=1 Tax=Eptatretus burgeri TaxID=7764 RepID=A0A8C4QF94_EPTBU